MELIEFWNKLQKKLSLNNCSFKKKLKKQLKLYFEMKLFKKNSPIMY